MTEVWILVKDWGYEGYGEPEAVFSSLEKAEKGLAKLEPNLSVNFPFKSDNNNFVSYAVRSDGVCEGWDIIKHNMDV